MESQPKKDLLESAVVDRDAFDSFESPAEGSFEISLWVVVLVALILAVIGAGIVKIKVDADKEEGTKDKTKK